MEMVIVMILIYSNLVIHLLQEILQHHLQQFHLHQVLQLLLLQLQLLICQLQIIVTLDCIHQMVIRIINIKIMVAHVHQIKSQIYLLVHYILKLEI